MEKIVRELEDLQHSQQAIIQKLGKIEVDNIELSDKIFSGLSSTISIMYQVSVWLG